MSDTGKVTENQQASSSTGGNTRFLYGFGKREKQPDPEKGLSANLGKSAETKPSPYEQHRAEIKQQFKDTLTSHEDGEASLDHPSAQVEHIEADAKKVVDWLRKEVLSVTSDDRANKIKKRCFLLLNKDQLQQNF